MFLHLSVILSTGGMSAPVHAGIHAPRQTPPLGRHPLGNQTPPGKQTPHLEADTPMGSRHPPGKQRPSCPRKQTPPEADTPRGSRHSPGKQTPPTTHRTTTTAADDTHPTGMHSCNIYFYRAKKFQCLQKTKSSIFEQNMS